MLTRIEKARFVGENGFAKIAGTNKNGLATSVHVPGSRGRQYLVLLRRNGNISTECLLDTGYGHIQCKGNTVTVCYHSIAALIEVARQNDFQITAVCKTIEDAELRSRLGGKIMQVDSRQGGKSMYLVYEPTN